MTNLIQIHNPSFAQRIIYVHIMFFTSKTIGKKNWKNNINKLNLYEILHRLYIFCDEASDKQNPS